MRYLPIGLLCVVIILLIWLIKRTYLRTIYSKWYSITQLLISVGLVGVTWYLAVVTYNLFKQTKRYADLTQSDYQVRNRPFVKMDLNEIQFLPEKKEYKDSKGIYIGDYQVKLLESIKNFGNFPSVVIDFQCFMKAIDSEGGYSPIPKGEEINYWKNLSVFPGEPIKQTQTFYLTENQLEKKDKSGKMTCLFRDPTYLVFKITYSILDDKDGGDKFIYWVKYRVLDSNSKPEYKDCGSDEQRFNSILRLEND